MPAHPSPADGARVLKDLNALRAIGAYKTGVHKPTFSDAHIRSLNWLITHFGAAELNADIDGIGNVVGRSAKARTARQARIGNPGTCSGAIVDPAPAKC